MPETTHKFTGTVATEDGLVSSGLLAYAEYKGFVKTITIAEDGSFRVDLPEGEYTIYCESNEYMRFGQKVSITADENISIVLKRSYLSSNNVEDWDRSRLGEGIVVCKNAGWRVDATHILVSDAPDQRFVPLTKEPITPREWDCKKVLPAKAKPIKSCKFPAKVRRKTSCFCGELLC